MQHEKIHNDNIRNLFISINHCLLFISMNSFLLKFSPSMLFHIINVPLLLTYHTDWCALKNISIGAFCPKYTHQCFLVQYYTHKLYFITKCATMHFIQHLHQCIYIYKCTDTLINYSRHWYI